MTTPQSALTARSDKELFRILIKLAVPIMLANMLQTMYNLADAFFLGRIGREAVSAPSISFTLIWFTVVFGMGMTIAGTTLISQSKGKGDQEKIDFYLGQMTVFLLFLSFVIMAVGLIFARPLLALLQVPADAYDLTYQYMTIIFAGMPFMFMSFVLQSAMQGLGDSVTPLLIKLGSVVFNIALDPILIFGLFGFPRLEVAGAAIATVIAQALASLAAVVIIVRGKRGMKLRVKNLCPDWSAIKRILQIGLPASIGQGFSAFGFTVLQGVVNGFGTAVIAAFGIGNRIIGLFNMPGIGFARATATLVGQSIGGKRPDLAKKVVRQSVITMSIFISISMTFTFFWGNSFMRFFVDDPEVIAHGALMFRIVSASVVLFTLFTVVMGAFEGGGDTKPVMFLNVFRLWGLRVPVAFGLAIVIGMGPVGIWIAMFVSNFVTAGIGFVVLSRGHWLTKMNPDEL